MADGEDLRTLVSINEACARTAVCRKTIHNWIAHGKVDYVRTAGGRVRIYVDSLFRQPNGDPLVPR